MNATASQETLAEAASDETAASRPEDRVRDAERFTGHRVRLAVYEGPLDLLLYLIRAHRYDICDVPIREVTNQFCEFIALMNELDLEYAGDFLVTAASLMQIKSRMLLPQYESQNEDALEQEIVDPRAEMVERLLQLQRYQDAAEELKTLREERANTYARLIELPKSTPESEEVSASVLLHDISTFDLLRALQKVLERQAERPVTTIRRDPFSLAERVRDVLKMLGDGTSFGALCDDCQSRLEVVITFLAILELISRKKIVVEQNGLFDEIWLRRSSES